MKIHEASGTMEFPRAVERAQPVCKGVDAAGELVWEGQEMARWQMAEFPREYTGAFRAYWMMRNCSERTGCERGEETITSVEAMDEISIYYAEREENKQ